MGLPDKATTMETCRSAPGKEGGCHHPEEIYAARGNFPRLWYKVHKMRDSGAREVGGEVRFSVLTQKDAD